MLRSDRVLLFFFLLALPVQTELSLRVPRNRACLALAFSHGTAVLEEGGKQTGLHFCLLFLASTM